MTTWWNRMWNKSKIKKWKLPYTFKYYWTFTHGKMYTNIIGLFKTLIDLGDPKGPRAIPWELPLSALIWNVCFGLCPVLLLFWPCSYLVLFARKVFSHPHPHHHDVLFQNFLPVLVHFLFLMNFRVSLSNSILKIPVGILIGVIVTT